MAYKLQVGFPNGYQDAEEYDRLTEAVSAMGAFPGTASCAAVFTDGGDMVASFGDGPALTWVKPSRTERHNTGKVADPPK